MLQVFSISIYLVIFIPIWVLRKVTGFSRFGRRFHLQPSAWDRPVGVDASLPTAMAQYSTRSIFLKIWGAIFLSSLATFFLLMVLAARVFNDSTSPLASNMIVLTQWIPAVLALPLIRRAGARYSARNLLLGAEFASALIVPSLGLISGAYYAMIVLLLVKGGLDSLSKMARAVALKSYFTDQSLHRAASYYNTAMLAGAGIGALLGAILLSVLPLGAILGICTLCHMLAGYLYTRLPAPQAAITTVTANKQSAYVTPADPRLRISIIYYISTVVLFQGFQNVARSVFPTEQLGMSSSGIALIQTIASFTYIIGAVLAARLDLSGKRYNVIAPMVHVFTLALLVPLPFITQVFPGLAMYGIFALVFELAWSVHQRYMIVAAPPEQISKIVANANAIGLGMMIIVALLGSILVEHIGFGIVTLAFIVLAVIVPVLMRVFVGKPREPLVVTDGE
ncbi:MFS transporter [Pantoea ananatis]|uniref:MFS transporter n=1 Tax=Pantoea ananas TaxID=553 RepID=UPI001F4E3CA4|nr:MFS transporter [Pantoea ananatis]MCH9271756.1 MFS transporter [Pantoea ananatis]